MRTGLTKQEKTTDIWFDEKDPLIYIRTHNTDLKNRLTAYAVAHPDQGRQTDVLETAKRAIRLSGGTSATSRHAHFYQAQANQGHYDTRHQRRNDPAHIFQDPANQHLDRSGRHTNTKDHGKSARQARRNDRSDKRETRSLDTEQPGSNTTNPLALDKSGHSRSE